MQVSYSFFPCVILDEVSHLKGLNLSTDYRSSLSVLKGSLLGGTLK